MQWALSSLARSAHSRARSPHLLLFHSGSVTTTRALLISPQPSRSISSSSFIRSQPQVSLKHRPSQVDDSFHPTPDELSRPPQQSPLSQLTSSINPPYRASEPHLPEAIEPSRVSPPELHRNSEHHSSLPSTSHLQSPLPSARLAILAANAVRQACSTGTFRDASYIINSLQSSQHANPPKLEPFKLPFMPAFEFAPITFDKPISPRLSAHVMLHHMLRNESPLKAYETAQALMKKGIPLREATLMKVTEALLQAPPTAFSVLKEKGTTMFRSANFLSRDLPIDPDKVKEDGPRFALMLLLRARENRRQCSDRAFEALVNFCLLQGEIIMGSLLFVLIIKDYEIKAQSAQEIKAKMMAQEECQRTTSPKLVDRWQELNRSRIPSKKLLKAITERCEEELTNDPEANRQDALQALANLAGLIESRSMPFSDISHLLRALYSSPKLPNSVSVEKGDERGRINAHRYFHRVLFGLLNDLPTKKGKDPPGKHPGERVSVSQVMPSLSRETYNSLIHYALRHRLSVSLARDVLHHMEHVRRPTLKPDVATYNIIVRSGTLLRQDHLVSFALTELRKLQEKKPRSAVTVSSDTHSHNPRPELTKHSLSSPTLSNIPSDAFTLTSYITHLTSAGKPHVVADILFHVLPELAVVDHPSWGDQPPNAHDRALMARRARQERIRRAVSLGPYFFTTVLNALCKIGKTGLAERVYLLAKQAEKASWVRHAADGHEAVEGWCLPIHAYTIMLQLYGKEARKGLDLRAGIRDADWGNRWQPQPSTKGKVKGWAYYVLAKSAIARKHRSRRTIGLRMGTVLYRAMFRAARDIYDSITRLVPNAQPRIYHLEPDARFFNAALAMFSRQAGMVRRASKTGPAHWRQLERRAMVRYSRRGVVRKFNPFMGRILQGMMEAGYEVPKAYRSLLLGSWMEGSMNHRGIRALNRQPHAFPKQKERFLPHTLQTHKERGLPVRRDEWKKAGHGWRERRRMILELKRKRMTQRTRKVS